MEKMPPFEKIHEAWSALADGRVTMAPEENRAAVRSSNGEREYTVTWDGDTYMSGDSASVWQGYPGYPVIAVLMLQGRIPYDSEAAGWFSGVDWNDLNKTTGRNYAESVNRIVRERGLDEARVKETAQRAWEALRALDLTVRRPKKSRAKAEINPEDKS